MNMCPHCANYIQSFKFLFQVHKTKWQYSIQLKFFVSVNTTRRHSKFSNTKRHGSHSTTNSSTETTGGVTKSHNETDNCDILASSSSPSNLDRPSSSMQRANRPPDLDLSTTQSLLHNTMTEKIRIPKHASTPEKFLTNQIQDVSLSIRPIGVMFLIV